MATLATAPTGNTLDLLLQLFPQLLGSKSTTNQSNQSSTSTNTSQNLTGANATDSATLNTANIQALLDTIANFDPGTVKARTQAGIDYQTSRLLQGPLLNFINAQNSSGGYGGVNPYLSQLVTDAAGQGAVASNAAVTSGGQIAGNAAAAIAAATKATAQTQTQTNQQQQQTTQNQQHQQAQQTSTVKQPPFSIVNALLGAGIAYGAKKGFDLLGAPLSAFFNSDTASGAATGLANLGGQAGLDRAIGSFAAPTVDNFPLADLNIGAGVGDTAGASGYTYSMQAPVAFEDAGGLSVSILDVADEGASLGGAASAAGGVDLSGAVGAGIADPAFLNEATQIATETGGPAVSIGTGAGGAALLGNPQVVPGFSMPPATSELLDLAATDLAGVGGVSSAAGAAGGAAGAAEAASGAAALGSGAFLGPAGFAAAFILNDIFDSGGTDPAVRAAYLKSVGRTEEEEEVYQEKLKAPLVESLSTASF